MKVYAKLMDRALGKPLPQLRQFIDNENMVRGDNLMRMVEDACRHAYVEGCRDGYAEAVRDVDVAVGRDGGQ